MQERDPNYALLHHHFAVFREESPSLGQSAAQPGYALCSRHCKNSCLGVCFCFQGTESCCYLGEGLKLVLLEPCYAKKHIG